MKRLFPTIIAMLLVMHSAALHGEEKITFTTLDGKAYENVKVTRSTGDGIVVMHTAGMAKIPFENLPAEIQTKYGYDPAKAKMAREQYERSQRERLRRQQMQTEQKAKATALENEPKIALMMKVKDVEDGYFVCKRVRWISGDDPPWENQNFIVVGHPQFETIAEGEFFTASMVRGKPLEHYGSMLRSFRVVKLMPEYDE